jgi:SapC protein
MMPPALYKKPAALDRERHRQLRLNTVNNYAFLREMNSLFLTVGEFADAGREYPIVFIPAGKDESTGEENLAPVAVLGLAPGENLFLKPDGWWAADYLPAFARRYPFAMAHMDKDTLAVAIDEDYAGFSQTEGERLFEADGQPTQYLKNVHEFLENFEREAERTRLFCRELQQAGLLQPMRFDAQLPNGQSLGVDGFFAINADAFNALSDAKILAMHKNGMLGLIHLQQASLGNMRRLAQRRAAASAS